MSVIIHVQRFLADRRGVGTIVQSKNKRVSAVVSAMSATKRARAEVEQRDFRQRMSDKFAGVEVLRDLTKSQRACFQLDQSKVRWQELM